MCRGLLMPESSCMSDVLLIFKCLLLLSPVEPGLTFASALAVLSTAPLCMQVKFMRGGAVGTAPASSAAQQAS